MPARSRDRPPGPSADRRRLLVRPDSGLFWSMNWDSWEVPKNSLMVAFTGRMLIRVCGVMASMSWVVMRSRTTRSMRRQTGADLVLDQLADLADTTVAEVVDIVDVHAQVGVLPLRMPGRVIARGAG